MADADPLPIEYVSADSVDTYRARWGLTRYAFTLSPDGIRVQIRHLLGLGRADLLFEWSQLSGHAGRLLYRENTCYGGLVMAGSALLAIIYMVYFNHPRVGWFDGFTFTCWPWVVAGLALAVTHARAVDIARFYSATGPQLFDVVRGGDRAIFDAFVNRVEAAIRLAKGSNKSL
jgi:hypothetical protein